MKTTLLLFCIYLVSFQVRAQENSWEVPSYEFNPKVNVASENRMLQRRLLLNEDQFHKVEIINTERNELLEKVAGMYRFDPENYTKKVLELELQYDAEFEKVLTKQQYAEYLAMNGRDKKEPQETEKTELASETDELNKSTRPTFNEQIHAILEKATAVKIDTALVAKQDNDFRELTPDEQLILEGLMPQNAALLEIKGDTLKKQKTVAKTDIKVDSANSVVKSEPAINTEPIMSEEKPAIISEVQSPDTTSNSIANTEVKPDGECKTCFDVNPDKSAEKIALNEPKKKAAKDNWNADKVQTDAHQSNNEAITDSLFSETPDGTEVVDEELAIIPEQRLNEPAPEVLPESDNGKQPAQIADADKNENSLVIPADEVKKLQESLQQPNQNGTISEEKSADPELETPQLNEPIPLNKSLAEEVEP